jgi:hypothetical protein
MSPFFRQLSKVQKIILVVIGGLLLVVLVVLAVPSLRESVMYRWEEVTTRVYFMVFQPEKSAFVPQQGLTPTSQGTLATETPLPATLTPSVIPTEAETATPMPTPTALPALVLMDKIPYVDQHYGFNNCAPSNLAMQLAYWGWTGKREDISPVVKPFDKDKNVMPYELADYVNEKTSLKALVRYGGTIDLLKALTANGYPVVVEKGVIFRDIAGKMSWMGHYNIILGYDEAKQQFITHDSFLEDGKFKRFDYSEIQQEWRAFNYIFLVVYPADRWDNLSQVLGAYADEAQSYKLALDISAKEISTTSGSDHFFAIFNRGTSLVKLQDYGGGALAYDEAYNYYATLPEQNRPYRMSWYQTGPYFAYYYTGRYQDVVKLADLTLKTTNEPYLEESYYWRALGEEMLGQKDDAVTDLCTAVKYHTDFSPATTELTNLGVSACP